MENELKQIVQDWRMSGEAMRTGDGNVLALARRAYEAGLAAEARRMVEGREDE